MRMIVCSNRARAEQLLDIAELCGLVVNRQRMQIGRADSPTVVSVAVVKSMEDVHKYAGLPIDRMVFDEIPSDRGAADWLMARVRVPHHRV